MAGLAPVGLSLKIKGFRCLVLSAGQDHLEAAAHSLRAFAMDAPSKTPYEEANVGQANPFSGGLMVAAAAEG